MDTNIWGEEVLDSKDYYDESSVLFNSEVLNSDVFNNSTNRGDIDNLEGGYYYKVDGEFLGREGKSQNVFLADDKILEDIIDEKGKKIGERIKFINSKPLYIENAFLVQNAATTYAEGSQPYGYRDVSELTNEALTISRIHFKYPHIKAYGATAPEAKRFKSLSEKKRNGGFTQIYVSSVIQSVLGTDITNGSTHWDGVDVLCGRASYGWDASKHQKQKPEGKFKGISDPNGLASDFYNKWKMHLEYMLSLPNLNETVRNDFKIKYDHLKPLELYSPEYDENEKLKFQPLYEIRATYALSLFYKKIRF